MSARATGGAAREAPSSRAAWPRSAGILVSTRETATHKVRAHVEHRAARAKRCRSRCRRGLHRRRAEEGVSGDGPSALRAIDELHPHLGVIDIRLPGMSGYELVETIRCDPARSTMRLIALSGVRTSLGHRTRPRRLRRSSVETSGRRPSHARARAAEALKFDGASPCRTRTTRPSFERLRKEIALHPRRSFGAFEP